MRLIDDFFKVLDTTVGENGFYTTIELNPGHLVYTGHFPGFPVTPGVVQLQIVQELLEKHLGRRLRLHTLAQGKFLKTVNPNETRRLVVLVTFVEEAGGLRVNARGEWAGEVYFRVQGEFFYK